MKICVLGSGSRGNAILISSGDTRLLLDCGLSARAVANRLLQIGEDPAGLSGLILSHEHGDHIAGVRLMAQRYRLPVYANKGTLEATGPDYLGTPQVELFQTNLPFKLGELALEPFTVCHDAAEPVAFSVTSSAGKVGIALDLGMITGLVRQKLKGCQVLILEFNHDPDMLLAGPYPWELKQRVKSGWGHLSNDQSAQLLEEIADGDLRWVILAHLSQVNNLPARAWRAAQMALKRAGCRQAKLTLAKQHAVGEVIVLDHD